MTEDDRAFMAEMRALGDFMTPNVHRLLDLIERQAAEIERLRPVVEAAIMWRGGQPPPALRDNADDILIEAVDRVIAAWEW